MYATTVLLATAATQPLVFWTVYLYSLNPVLLLPFMNNVNLRKQIAVGYV